MIFKKLLKKVERIPESEEKNRIKFKLYEANANLCVSAANILGGTCAYGAGKIFEEIYYYGLQYSGIYVGVLVGSIGVGLGVSGLKNYFDIKKKVNNCIEAQNNLESELKSFNNILLNLQHEKIEAYLK